MSLDFQKVTYVDGSTIIGADNLNNIQDAILDLDDDKVEKVTGKGLSTEDYTSDEKTKLSGIQSGAQVNPGRATTSADGLMSSTDKAKLDGIEQGATAVTVDTTLSVTGNAADAKATGDSISAINAKIPAAASSVNKLMDAAAVNSAIATAISGITGFSYEIVQTLPASGEAGTIYLILQSGGGKAQNIYNEYIWIADKWEMLGTTEVDLSQYRTASAQDIIDAAKLDKTGDGSDVTAAFTEASTRSNLSTGEKLSVLFGKIAKWFSDLGSAAFRSATSSITQNSTELIESGAVYTGLSGKYSKPPSGIPESDLSTTVQDSLAKAGTSLQDIQIGVVETLETGEDAYATVVNSGGTSTLNLGLPKGNTGTQGQTGPQGPAGPGLPAGGSAGQIPVKASATDYDFVWRYPQYCRPNLLDNWYFAQNGGLPVNQRGQNQYSTAGAFALDRWKLISGTVEITANGLILNGTIQQTIETAINQQYTACVLTSVDVVAASFNQSTKVFSITSDGSTVIKAAKLELGSYQTLAHNEGTDENPNWMLNAIPNYSEEFNKCLMYFERVKGQYVGFATGYSTNGTNAYVCGKVNPKVKAPSITLSGTIYLQSANHAGSDSSVSTSIVSVFALPSGNFSFICQSSNMVQGEFNQAQFRDTTSYLDFSAE